MISSSRKLIESSVKNICPSEGHLPNRMQTIRFPAVPTMNIATYKAKKALSSSAFRLVQVALDAFVFTVIVHKKPRSV